jgi:hypothetical protein
MIIRFFPKVTVWVCVLIYLANCQSPVGLPAPDPDNGGLLLPEGFKALVVADRVGRARHLAVRDNGDIYVKLSWWNCGLTRYKWRWEDGFQAKIWRYPIRQ